MATRENTRASGESPLRRCLQGECIKFIGTREQLLEAGAVGPETPFPGDPGQRKTFIKLTADPHRVLAIWKSTHGRFRVEAMRDEADLAEFRAQAAANNALWEQRCKLFDESRAAMRRLDQAPQSFDDYRRRFAGPGAALVRAITDAAGRLDAGYRYAPDVTDELALHAQAIERLLMTGVITFDPDGRDAERARLHAVAAAGDGRFDRFMRKAKARA
jgi:hypothetical protein